MSNAAVAANKAVSWGMRTQFSYVYASEFRNGGNGRHLKGRFSASVGIFCHSGTHPIADT